MYKSHKMKVLRILLLSTLLSFTIFSVQASSLDSLQRIADQLSGTQRIDTYNKLAHDALANADIGVAIQLSRKAIALAESEKYQAGMADAHDVQGETFEVKYDYTNAMTSYVNALKLRNEIGDRNKISRSKDNIGRVFLLQEDYVQAEENLIEALQIQMSNSDMVGAAASNELLGDVYLSKKTYGKAQEYFRTALEYKLEVQDKRGAIKIADKIGQLSSDLGDYDGALVYYKMSLNLHSSLGEEENIADDHNKLAETYIAQKEYEDALDENNKAYAIRQKVNSDFGQAESAKNYGVIYAATGKKQLAKEWLDKSYKALRKVKTNPNKPEIYKEIAEAYANMEMFEKAFQFHKGYANSRAKIFSQEKSRALVELTTKYESEFAAEEQARQIQQLETEQSAATKLRWFLIAVIGLIALFLISLFNSYRIKKKDNVLLQQKNEEVELSKAKIDEKNKELADKNANLDLLNTKLVDEIAEREAIEKSSFARDRFLATMSHEMRTPINIIVGLTHLLLEEKPREDQIEHLRTLQFSANNLVVFINDVLSFSHIEANKLILEKREFTPSKTFEEIRSRFALAARDRKLVVNYDYDKKIPEKLWGDPVRFNQIITNLIGTSFSSTDEGRVDVSFELNKLENNKATILLRIEDNGRGIPEVELNKTLSYSPEDSLEDIFDGYSTSELGLAITKRLIELQNGKFEVESTEGVGTTFMVYMPYQIVAKKKPKQEEKSIAQNTPNLQGNTILLVEDNKINQLVVAKMLRKLNMEVITADDGLQALEEFYERDFDLILMDIQMPNMDGYRATAEIRKHPNPVKRDTPIIALTASAFLTEKDKAKLFGMNEHVGKPFSPDELLEKVYSLLGVEV